MSTRTEWVLLRAGKVRSIVSSTKSKDEMTADWPSYDVRMVSEVPVAVLREYRYWEERP